MGPPALLEPDAHTPAHKTIFVGGFFQVFLFSLGLFHLTSGAAPRVSGLPPDPVGLREVLRAQGKTNGYVPGRFTTEAGVNTTALLTDLQLKRPTQKALWLVSLI